MSRRGPLLALLSSLLVLAMLEGAARGVTGGVPPQLDCYLATPLGLRLQEGCTRSLRAANGTLWNLQLRDRGMRSPLTRQVPLVVGDSQILGWGVEEEAVWRAVAERAGIPMVAAGVPALGVGDALGMAEELLPELQPSRLFVVVNGANDWGDARAPALERLAVVGGHLLRPEAAASSVATFLGGPLRHSLLLSYAAVAWGRRSAPDPLLQRLAESPWAMPEALRQKSMRSIALPIHAFAARHPDLPLTVVFLPSDLELSEARVDSELGSRRRYLQLDPWSDASPWQELRTAVPDLQILDLHDALRDPSLFQAGDYHLSADGHAVLGRELAAAAR